MQCTDYNKAKQFVHNLKLKNLKEWKSYCKNNKLPIGIPTNPNREYEDFKGYGDWLGTNAISFRDKYFVDYATWKKIINGLKIDSKDKYIEWHKIKKPIDIPCRPDNTYKSEWISWGSFLETNSIPDIKKHNNFLKYDEAKEYLRKYNFYGESEFYNWAKSDDRPDFIPANPRKTYKANKTWVSMGDFLSNYNVHKKNFVSYEEAKSIVIEKQFNTIDEFKTWTQSTTNNTIPYHPNCVYKEEFEGYPEFLGYQRKVSNGEKIISGILSGNNILHSLQYTFDNCRDNRPLPFDIAILKDNNIILIEYHGIQHFEPIEFFGGAESLETNIKRDNIKEKFCKDNDIPLLIINYKENIKEKLYNYLISFNIKIDINKISPALNKNFLSYKQSKSIIQKYKFNNMKEFINFKDKPIGIPCNPQIIYKNNGWTSWGDFLGNNRVHPLKAKFITYEECKQWFKDNNIQSGEHWKKLRKQKPTYIPCNPDTIYKTEWEGWKKFLK
jgi:hypothetical protein